MKIAFRVDGNRTLGLGHVKRCMTIAKNLQKQNISCIFITKFKNIQELLKSKNFEVVRIPIKNERLIVKQILRKFNCDVLVIDSKRKSVGKLIKNLHLDIKIVLIDNINSHKLANLVIISSVEEPYKQYPQNTIVGIKYILHGIENIPKSFSKEKNSILLTMGGSDKLNITKKIVKSFLKSKNNFKLNIVLGKYYKNEKELLKLINHDYRFHVIKNPSSLADLMSKSEICIATFGITVYESAICKLPLFVISHSDENHHYATLVENYGWFSYIGKYNQIKYELLPAKIFNILSNKIKLKQMTQSCLQVDGLGPYRVAKILSNL